MSLIKRNGTKYPGVFFISGIVTGQSKPESIYYIRYRRNGKLIEEKVGSKSKDDMTPYKANNIRSERIRGKQPSNRERRSAEKELKKSENNKWTINKIWEHYKENNPEIKGIAIDKNRYRKHLEKNIGSNEFVNLTPNDINTLKKTISKGRSPATVKNVLELLRRLSNFAQKQHLCPGLSFTIKMPKINNIKTEYLTNEEIIRLKKAIDKDPNQQVANLMKLALFTGMRRGELFKLKWEDIKFEQGFIKIVDPKGGEDRQIPLNEAARDLLEKHPRGKSPYVFPGKKGSQRKDINHQANRIKKNAKLPENFRPLHGLRHTYASLLASSGKVDMYVLQKLMTHKHVSTTQRYAHLHDDALKRAASLGSDLIMGTSSPIDRLLDSSIGDLSNYDNLWK